MPGDNFPFDRLWPLPDAFHMACLFEVTAAKIGNVHPAAAFADMHVGHFISSAAVLRGIFDKARAAEILSRGVGRLVLDCVQATRGQVGCNTNLGTVLLLAPIACGYWMVAADEDDEAVEQAHLPSKAALQAAVKNVLATLTPEDGRLVYEAIRRAHPGGLGARDVDDVSGIGPMDLVSAMQQVASVDAVARQYTNGCGDLFDRLLPWFAEELQHVQNAEQTLTPLEAVCRLQLRWLAHEPDGLILRKNGAGLAKDIQQRAISVWQQVRSLAGPVTETSQVRELDQFLRADGHRRNPGTTADLIAATLAIALLVDFKSSDG